MDAQYLSKAPAYYEEQRSEMLPFIPLSAHRVLDVGCGAGAFSAMLRAARGVEIWGIEPHPEAAARASSRLDRVIQACFGPDLDLPRWTFDAVVFNDVLEHLPDPVASLRFARTLLSPNGVVVASIPNVRHFPTFWQIAIRGQWTYRDYGILDRTHVRFFTRRSIAPLFAEAGFEVERLEGINEFVTPYPEEAGAWRTFRILQRVTFGALEDMKPLQYAVVGRPFPLSAS